MHYLKVYWPALTRVLSTLGTLTSVVALLIPPPASTVPWTLAQKAALTFSVVAFVATAAIEFLAFKKVRTRARGDREGIRKYMHRWIEHGGRVAIWTRDHSWIDEDTMRSMLKEKAARRELILCLPSMTPFANELANLGADVVAYGDGLGVPSIRFTIAHLDQPGACVAIARPNSDSHVIEEYTSSDHIAFHLAQDLVRLAVNRRAAS